MVRFLGEGGKKRVYLAHDTLLDRDVAFALIKTEGLDDEGRERILREAQAMGKLGTHPHIVSVYDIGVEPFDGAQPLSAVSGGGTPSSQFPVPCRGASPTWSPSSWPAATSRRCWRRPTAIASPSITQYALRSTSSAAWSLPTNMA